MDEKGNTMPLMSYWREYVIELEIQVTKGHDSKEIKALLKALQYLISKVAGQPIPNIDTTTSEKDYKIIFNNANEKTS